MQTRLSLCFFSEATSGDQLLFLEETSTFAYEIVTNESGQIGLVFIKANELLPNLGKRNVATVNNSLDWFILPFFLARFMFAP